MSPTLCSCVTSFVFLCHRRSVEVGEVSISQSVECPLTPSDTVVIGGSVSTRNGRGQGGVSAVWRRILSSRSWTEVRWLVYFFCGLLP